MNEQSKIDKPPLFPSWKWWYGLVLGNLGLLILLFILITHFFS